jgi:hypothetical protein
LGLTSWVQFIAEEGLAHAVTEAMGYEAISWFNKYLRPGEVLLNSLFNRSSFVLSDSKYIVRIESSLLIALCCGCRV